MAMCVLFVLEQEVIVSTEEEFLEFVGSVLLYHGGEMSWTDWIEALVWPLNP